MNSSFEAVAQGAALVSEFAMDQVNKWFGSWDEVIVVFVLTYGGAIQFGAVYIGRKNFLCALDRCLYYCRGTEIL